MTRWRINDIQRGLRLRECGLSYPAIAVVFREYHNLDVTEGSVRHVLRRYGASPAPRGATGNLWRGRVPA